MPGRDDYEQRKQDRIDRYKARAEQADVNSAAAYQRSHDITYPMNGQPILIGHHSEKGHRAALKRADNAMRRSSEEASKAKHYSEKALAAERNRAISSDNPDALSLLRSKLANEESNRQRMKDINAAWRRAGKPTADNAEGWRKVADDPKVMMSDNDLHATRMKIARCHWEPSPFPKWEISNLGANIRRIKERIKTLEATAGDETTEETIGDVRIVDNVEENRLQLFFPGKPDEETRRKLKSLGFRWCRSEGCWQAFRGNGATAKAKAILEA